MNVFPFLLFWIFDICSGIFYNIRSSPLIKISWQWCFQTLKLSPHSCPSSHQSSVSQPDGQMMEGPELNKTFCLFQWKEICYRLLLLQDKTWVSIRWRKVSIYLHMRMRMINLEQLKKSRNNFLDQLPETTRSCTISRMTAWPATATWSSLRSRGLGLRNCSCMWTAMGTGWLVGLRILSIFLTSYFQALMSGREGLFKLNENRNIREGYW